MHGVKWCDFQILGLQKENAAYQLIRSEYNLICEAISGEEAVIPRLADMLQAYELISRDTQQAVKSTPSLPPYEKATRVMGPVRDKILGHPDFIHQLIDIFKKCDMNVLARDLARNLEKSELGRNTHQSPWNKLKAY